MSATKIKYWEAESIATLIATEAMKHLIEPLDQAVKEHCLKCYASLLNTLAIAGREKEFIDAGILREVDATRISFHRNADDGQVEVVSSAGMNKLLLTPGIYENWRVSDETLVAEYHALTDQKVPFIMRREALKQELKSQIEGKSAKHVMKVWPEAAQFVANEFNIDITGKDVSMVVPLGQLLAKYMPMLSAPQAQGV